MAGSWNDVLYGVNLDFTGNHPPTGQITQNGQLLIGSASPPFIRAGSLTAFANGGLQVNSSAGALSIQMSPPYALGAFTFSNSLQVGSSSPTVPVDLNIEKSTSGGIVELEIRNTSNTASSNSLLGIVVGGSSAEDPFVVYNIAGTQSWTHGIDNSDSDKWKLSASNSLGTTDTFVMTTAGQRTMPLQPAFSVYLSTSATNITGAGTTYTFGTAGGGATTTSFDQGTNITSPAGVLTFTAPIAGKYFLHFVASFSSITASMTAVFVNIVPSVAPTIQNGGVNPGAVMDSSNVFNMETMGFVTLTAGETVIVQLNIGGGAADTVGLRNGAGITYFEGYLVC